MLNYLNKSSKKLETAASLGVFALVFVVDEDVVKDDDLLDGGGVCKFDSVATLVVVAGDVLVPVLLDMTGTIESYNSLSQN